MNLSDDDLQFELQKRLQYYLENKIITPNLMYSVVLGNRVYFNCSFLNNEIPYEVRKVLSRKVRKIFFSVTGNFLGKWDIDYGEIQPNEIKSHWLISQKFNIQNSSFIITPYDSSYHYDNLYDFSIKKFPSIKPIMKKVLKFCSKHLTNPQIKERELFTEFLKEKESSSEIIQQNRIPSLNSYLKSHLPKAQIENNKDISNVTRIFQEAQVKNTNIFLSPENTSMKEIQVEINWPRIGLEEYIVSFKVKKDTIYP